MAEGRTEKASGGRLGSPEKRTKDENEDETSELVRQQIL
jgi:hypothetical protein